MADTTRHKPRIVLLCILAAVAGAGIVPATGLGAKKSKKMGNKAIVAMVRRAYHIAERADRTARASVQSWKIADGQVQTQDLADGSVTSAKLADGTVTAADLATGAVTAASLVSGSVSSSALADGAVTGAKIL